MGAPLKKARLDDPVTRYMHEDFTRLSAGQTVGQALDWLRSHPPPGRIIYFYVVDDEGRLRGVVPTRRLVLQSPTTPVTEIMVPHVVTLPEEATVLDACEFFIQHRLLAFPVVDKQERILGVVDMDLYTDELGQLEDAGRRDDLFQMIGVRLADARGAAISGFRRRFPWLGCNLAVLLLLILCHCYR